MTKHNQPVGAWGEQSAANYLIEHGCEILARNEQTPCGEIDIIAKQKDITVFIEVKTLSRSRYIFPEHKITPRQHEHRLTAAEHYSAEHRIDHRRIDGIAVEGKAGTTPVITYFQNAI
jgi:putative endonuclease